ncbi:MAG: flagellar biosynthesis protein FlhA [Nevskiaceae bacterium]|nr:MAG: flagellar biosynthesis protein FlhA [Nevskiaceae bacterium]TBR75164.1 MAG: flagellar biosynthesis protein FlhA [Nevskiaceae bacterium]
MQLLRQAFGSRSDVGIIVAVLGILFVLFFPIPAGLLDFLLILNLSFALLILLLTFYTDKPLAFSTFPSLLLIATLFRLSLNIAATRLILSQGDAGRVIATIGQHVVSGNYVIGIVVFAILIVVQYVVVTNGAQRVAEVAARFTLDAMPGKQMSIDAEMNMGLIDEAEAKRRRALIEREASFYGAMDGASKFVKGDAIAAIVIILIDIIGGLSVGLVQRGLSWSEALNLYTLLTVGDGIVTQIPALVIATATGIIVTRAATDAHLSEEIARQITRYPKSLITVGVGLLMALAMPGIPAMPVALLLAADVALIVFALRAQRRQETSPDDPAGTQAPSEPSADTEDLRALLPVDPIEILIGSALVPILGEQDGIFMRRIQAFRRQFALDFGFVFQQVRIRDTGRRNSQDYEVRILGARIAQGRLLPDHLLAINPGGERPALEGIQARDPTFGLPAIWIPDGTSEHARRSGYTVVDPVTVLATHFSELVKNYAGDLLSRGETEVLFNQLRERQPTLVEELIPGVLSLGEIQRVLQNLLRENVSIRNLEYIAEVLLDQGRSIKDADVLTELVRQRLGNVICDRLGAADGAMHVLTLDPTIEERLRQGLKQAEKKTVLILDPQMLENFIKKLAQRCEEMMVQSLSPVLLCSPSLRRHIRKLTERSLPQLAILSLNEVPQHKVVKSFGMLEKTA